MSLVVIIGLFIAMAAWKFGSGHSWVYRSPYSRRCSVCKEINDAYDVGNKDLKWEVMLPLGNVDTAAKLCGGSN